MTNDNDKMLKYESASMTELDRTMEHKRGEPETGNNIDISTSVERTDLTREVFRADGCDQRFLEMNRGSLAERYNRLCALAYRHELDHVGFTHIDSCGPCVLAYRVRDIHHHPKVHINDIDGSYDVWMYGPAGCHKLWIDEDEIQSSDHDPITARARLAWLGFLDANKVEVPDDVLERAVFDHAEELEAVRAIRKMNGPCLCESKQSAGYRRRGAIVCIQCNHLIGVHSLAQVNQAKLAKERNQS